MYNENENPLGTLEPNIENAPPEIPLNFPSGSLTESNLAMGILSGALASILCAVLWAVITVVTGYVYGFAAIGVGFVVGISVRLFGKGDSVIFGLLGAVFALLGCLLGNFFAVIAIFAQEFGFTYTETLGTLGITGCIDVMTETSSPMDLLFYGIAIYEGFKFSFISGNR